MQSPTSAFFKAIASAILSPVIPTKPPACFIPAIKINLSSAEALAIILNLLFTLLNAYGSLNSILYFLSLSSQNFSYCPIASLNI